MVTVMGKFDWATGFSHIWSNIILGMSESVFLDEIHIWIYRWNKANCPSYVRGPYPITEGLNRRKRLTLSFSQKKKLVLPDCSELGEQCFLAISSKLGSCDSWLSDWSHTPALRGLQQARWGSWVFSASKNHMSWFHIYNYTWWRIKGINVPP